MPDPILSCTGPSAGPLLVNDEYKLDVASGTLRVSALRVPSCPDAGGNESTSNSVVLAAADRDAVLALARAMVLQVETDQWADVGGDTVTVRHATGSQETYGVNSSDAVAVGACGINATQFEALMGKLKTVLPP
jgi:hypothetical protein